MNVISTMIRLLVGWSSAQGGCRPPSDPTMHRPGELLLQTIAHQLTIGLASAPCIHMGTRLPGSQCSLLSHSRGTFRSISTSTTAAHEAMYVDGLVPMAV